jgi:HSP20 family protein
MKNKTETMNAVTRHESDGGVAKPHRVEYVLPAVNIYETEDGYLLEADMPGVTRDGLEISLDRNELILLGRRETPSFETTHYRESSIGDFRRVFELDPEIDTDKISARMESGVLTLTLAKRERLKPRKITVSD